MDKEGNPLRPSVVTPTPFESKDAWNSNLQDPADVLKFLMARNKYAGAIGMASNYAANLDMAGAFDPDRHLFCLSEDVISERTTNCPSTGPWSSPATPTTTTSENPKETPASPSPEDRSGQLHGTLVDEHPIPPHEWRKSNP